LPGRLRFASLPGFARRRLVLRADQPPENIQFTGVADADESPGIRFRRVRPCRLAFGQFFDPLLNLPKAVTDVLVLWLFRITP
jgi:hypothetical protein